MIRQARLEEASALSGLAQRSKAAWGYSDDFMRACRDELTVTAEEIEGAWVLDIDGCIAGFYGLSEVVESSGQDSEDQVAELDYLFVEPAQFRRGYGSQLFEHAKRFAAAQGFRTLVIQGDPNAAPFYLRGGAEPIGERTSASIPGRMLPLYEAAL